MPDALITALVTATVAGFGAVAAAIRWVGMRIVNAMDRNTTAQLESAKVQAVLIEKIEEVHAFVRGDVTPVEMPRGTYSQRRKENPR